MPSLDFELEKSIFREFHTSHQKILEDATDSFIALIKSLILHAGSISISKIEGRVKDREECIRKFSRKYLTELESTNLEYSIIDHISDLIGLRIVCLYEDDIERIENCISQHFEIIEKTNKIEQIEKTEGLFGYKGLHLDLRLNEARKNLPEYLTYSKFKFEIQIRTIIQDSWSVLDHKIKYKKSIPNGLKRRINTLAALFELADREFREIRELTKKEIEIEESIGIPSVTINSTTINKNETPTNLTAFGFLKIAKHFFPNFEFESHKVDGFTQEILKTSPNLNKKLFSISLENTISTIKKYQSNFEESNKTDNLNPYTIIRHCLFLSNQDTFKNILTNKAKENFNTWLSLNSPQPAPEPLL